MSSVSLVKSRVNAYAARRRKGLYFGHNDTAVMPGRKGAAARKSLAAMIKAKRKANKMYKGGKGL